MLLEQQNAVSAISRYVRQNPLHCFTEKSFDLLRREGGSSFFFFFFFFLLLLLLNYYPLQASVSRIFRAVVAVAAAAFSLYSRIGGEEGLTNQSSPALFVPPVGQLANTNSTL